MAVVVLYYSAARRRPRKRPTMKAPACTSQGCMCTISDVKYWLCARVTSRCTQHGKAVLDATGCTPESETRNGSGGGGGSGGSGGAILCGHSMGGFDNM